MYCNLSDIDIDIDADTDLYKCIKFALCVCVCVVCVWSGVVMVFFLFSNIYQCYTTYHSFIPFFFFDLYLLYLPIVSAGGGMEWTSNMNLNLDLFVELLGPTYLLTT